MVTIERLSSRTSVARSVRARVTLATLATLLVQTSIERGTIQKLHFTASRVRAAIEFGILLARKSYLAKE